MPGERGNPGSVVVRAWLPGDPPQRRALRTHPPRGVGALARAIRAGRTRVPMSRSRSLPAAAVGNKDGPNRALLIASRGIGLIDAGLGAVDDRNAIRTLYHEPWSATRRPSQAASGLLSRGR